jgi:tetratricopeptide (TPR) repeat protein
VRLTTAAKVDLPFFEQLILTCRGIHIAFERAVSQGGAGAATDSAVGLTEKIAAAVAAGISPALLQLSQRNPESSPRPEHRAWAEERWSHVKSHLPEDQSVSIDVLLGDSWSWALAERLCLASTEAAADQASEALRLARLAIRLAGHVPGPDRRRSALLGWCGPFLGNALRVGGDLPAAHTSFAKAERLWNKGAADELALLLDRTRPLDLKASLLRQEGKFADALDLLDQALAQSPPEAEARLLIQKAATYTRAGDYEEALDVLDQAESRIDPERDRRLLFLHRSNLALNRCHLDLYDAAEPLLPVVASLAADLGNQLDGIRSQWLQGRTWAGLGRRAEALAALTQVRNYLHEKKIAYDYALVTLEIAVLHLEEGRTHLVHELAEEMLWIFHNQNVHKEALAALNLFYQAAKAERAQPDWTRRLIKYLYQAQHNPRLRFGT